MPGSIRVGGERDAMMWALAVGRKLVGLFADSIGLAVAAMLWLGAAGLAVWWTSASALVGGGVFAGIAASLVASCVRASRAGRQDTGMRAGRFMGVLAAGFACCALAAAQAATPDPLDAALQSCLASPAAGTEAGGMACTVTAANGWSLRLASAYAALLRSVPASSRAALVTAEQHWTAYRDSDAAFAASPWRQQAGTALDTSIAASRLEELRAHVRALETYTLAQ